MQLFQKVFLLLICFPLFLSAQDENSKELEAKEFELPPFTNLRVYTGIDIKLIPSDVNKALVYGDNSDDIVLSSKKGTLRIKLKIQSIFNLGYNHVELYYTESLDLIDINQGSSLETDQILEQTYLEIKVNEEATLRAKINVSRLEAKVSTGSDLYLEGKASISELTINTGGSCEAEKLITEQTKIKVLGGGRAYVHTNGLLNASVTAGGIIRVYGNPSKRITKKVLSGKILFMD